MSTEKCKVCGNDEFIKGVLGNGFTSVTGQEKLLGSSRLILTFCSECGEVISTKVEHPNRLKKNE
ncbi:MAG TPA: hypothetical protein VLA13_10715 [Massilibacterium sp.]|nr:hypothetical protein [Massilibacterium sp.]